jgi:cold shock CspA family protein
VGKFIFRRLFVTGEIYVWNKEAKFGFVRTATRKTFYVGHSSFCDSRQMASMVAGITVEFEKRRDKSFDNALNAGSFRDDPRIKNHRNPRIVDETKSPVAAKVRVIRESQEPVVAEPETVAESESGTVLAPATRSKSLLEIILEKRGK